MLSILACWCGFADSPSTNATMAAAAGGAFSADSSWVEGRMPGGAGSTLTVKAESVLGADPWWLSFDRSVTLGHIIRPADAVQPAAMSGHEYNAAFLLSWEATSVECPNDYDPVNPSRQSTQRRSDAKLTFDSGVEGEPASIEHLVSAEDMRAKRFAMYLEPPMCLRSDLYVRHNGCADGIHGNDWQSGELGAFAYATIWLMGDICEEGGRHGLTIENPVYKDSRDRDCYNPTMLAGNNTFSGDVTVREGLVRLFSQDRFEGDSHALGENNAIRVTSGKASLDLTGTTAGLDGNTLHIGGMLARSEMGTLINTNPDPLVPGEWKGAVVVESETAIGGYPQIPTGENLGGGDIRVSGPVSGSSTVHLISDRTVELSGDNSAFTGVLSLEKGFLRLGGASAVGAGSVKFAGGAYRYGSAADGDLSCVPFDASNRVLQVAVDEGVVYHPEQRFKGLSVQDNCFLLKTGLGSLCLSEAMEYHDTRPNYNWSTSLGIESGEVILDYTENEGPKLTGQLSADGRGGGLAFAENARLVVRGAPKPAPERWMTGFFLLQPKDGALGEVRFEGDGGEYVLSRMSWEDRLNNGAVNFVGNPEQWHVVTDCPHGAADNGANDPIAAIDYPDIVNPGELWNGTSWTYKFGDYALPVPDSAYAKDFTSKSENATGPENSIVDVTPELCAAGPHAGVSCALLRFNTPNGGSPVVLELEGQAAVHGGAILITPNMGSTPVVIRGGSLARNPSNPNVNYSHWRIYNFNTNATLTIESDIVDNTALDFTTPEDNERRSLCFYGPGTTVFKGKNLTHGPVYVNGGRVVCGDGVGLLASVRGNSATYYSSDRWRDVYLFGGALLSFDQDAAWSNSVADPAGTFVNVLRPNIGATGGGIEVAEDKTLTVAGGVSRTIRRYPGARTIKAGDGTWKIVDGLNSERLSGQVMPSAVATHVASFEHRAGTLWVDGDHNNVGLVPTAFFGSQSATVVTAGDGAVFKGRDFTCPSVRHSIDVDSGVRYVVNGRAVFDRDSTSDSFPGTILFVNSMLWSTGYHDGGLFAGSGKITIKNSRSNAGFDARNFVNRLFTGVVRMEISDPHGYLTGSAFQFQNAELETVSGYAIDFDMSIERYSPARFGGLSGDGNVSCKWQSFLYTPVLCVGCDADGTSDFSGYLDLPSASGGAGYLLKIGSNAQRISGTANAVETASRVVGGRLLLGSPTALSSGGYAPTVYVGDAASRPDASPEFLADCGTVTVANPVKILACGSADVVPGVGAASGEATFGTVILANDCALVAEAGATARFDATKIVNPDGHAISKRGTGSVVVEGDYALSGDLSVTLGGAFAVEGTLTVPPGTKLSVDGLAEATLDPNVRYVLAEAQTISGSFDVSGLDIPDGWHITQTSRKVRLSPDSGLAIIVK